MAYDEKLAQRIRDELSPEPDVVEKEMFGGLAFMVGGHMAVAAGSGGGLMVRVAPADTDSLMAKPHVHPMVMQGREMSGWIVVDNEGLKTRASLAKWVGRGSQFARSLPAKS